MDETDVGFCSLEEVVLDSAEDLSLPIPSIAVTSTTSPVQ